MMKKVLPILFFLVFTVVRMIHAQARIGGELIVQFKYRQNPKAVLDKINSVAPVPHLQLGRCLSEAWNTWLVEYPYHADPDEFYLPQLRANAGVKLAQCNHVIEHRILEPDDPQYTSGAMWNFKNTGQSNGTADADIDAPEAWELTTGGLTSLGDTIVVAVIDGGFSLTHQDLNFWRNYADLPGDNLDNDNNGYTDDRNGWNAVSNTGNITSNSHGTHVAGTVGAIGNNNLGVTGVNWNVKVMAVQGSSSNEATVVAAYSYVAEQRRRYNQTAGSSGAFVVSTNASFGVNYGSPQNFPVWCAIYDSLGALGILSAGATANLNIDVDAQGDIPTACTSPWLISVTNTTRNDVRNSSAAYGLTSIDLGAPGTTIPSTLPSNTYGNQSGTSMATPHVAGAIGLMLSYACPQMIEDFRTHPDSIALLIKDYLLAGTDSISSLQNNTVSGGRLNLFKALQQMDNYPCVITSSLKKQILEKGEIGLTYFAPNPASSQAEIAYFLPGDQQASLEIFDMSGRLTSSECLKSGPGYHAHLINLSALDAGNYILFLRQAGQAAKPLKFTKLP